MVLPPRVELGLDPYKGPVLTIKLQEDMLLIRRSLAWLLNLSLICFVYLSNPKRIVFISAAIFRSRQRGVQHCTICLLWLTSYPIFMQPIYESVCTKVHLFSAPSSTISGSIAEPLPLAKIFICYLVQFTHKVDSIPLNLTSLFGREWSPQPWQGSQDLNPNRRGLEPRHKVLKTSAISHMAKLPYLTLIDAFS